MREHIKLRKANDAINDITQAADDVIYGDIDQQPLSLSDSVEKNRMKYVHIIPHSHLDLGWLGTIEDYFNGQNLEIYFGSVNSIITSVMQELPKNPNRTFTMAEVEFFKMWWDR